MNQINFSEHWEIYFVGKSHHDSEEKAIHCQTSTMDIAADLVTSGSDRVQYLMNV